MKNFLFLTTLSIMVNMSFAAEQMVGDATNNTVCMQNKEKMIVCKDVKSEKYSKVTGSVLGKSKYSEKSSIVYKYKDKDGQTVYSDSKMPLANVQVLDLNSKEMNDKISSY